MIEVENVEEIVDDDESVDDLEIVPDPDSETELVPQDDAQWVPDTDPL